MPCDDADDRLMERLLLQSVREISIDLNAFMLAYIIAGVPYIRSRSRYLFPHTCMLHSSALIRMTIGAANRSRCQLSLFNEDFHIIGSPKPVRFCTFWLGDIGGRWAIIRVLSRRHCSEPLLWEVLVLHSRYWTDFGRSLPLSLLGCGIDQTMGKCFLMLTEANYLDKSRGKLYGQMKEGYAIKSIISTRCIIL